MTSIPENIRLKIQELLRKKVSQIILKGKGACNNAYYIETTDGAKYIVKQERENKEIEEQNSLAIEGSLIKQLSALGLSAPLPRIAFVSEESKMYGYEYIEGEKMREVWSSISEEEKVDICRSLGRFHSEIGKRFTREMAEAAGTQIDESKGLHPEVVKEYEKLSIDINVPESFRSLAKEAKAIFDATFDNAVFQFIHNDAHHENVLINNKKISGIIDFGDAEYGEMANEFSRYIRDYPDYFQHIVSVYEEESGNKLSYERLISNALLSGFVEIVEAYQKGGEDKIQAENAMAKYKDLIAGKPR